MIRVEPQKAFETLLKLKGEGFNMLVDLTAVDWSALGKEGDASLSLKRSMPYEEESLPRPLGLGEGEEVGTPRLPKALKPVDPFLSESRPKRFEVVYRLMKLNLATGADEGREEVRAYVGEGEAVLKSVKSLWPIADWLEREIWDMFGVRFADRPDIKRLLLYEEFQGHPLRKDYPITRRQPLIGPKEGEPPDNPSFNRPAPGVPYE
jgi:NADH-quinone oxidoreductase subunit C